MDAAGDAENRGDRPPHATSAGRGGRAGDGRAHERASERARAELDEHVRALRTQPSELIASAERAFYVEKQRLYLTAVEGFFRGLFYVCLTAFALTGAISASLLVVRGISSALAAWSGAPWVGELGAGATLLVVLFSVA